jgi:predicted nucleic acid-binding protein
VCGNRLNYQHFLHEKVAYDVYLLDANILIYAFEPESTHRKYCHKLLMLNLSNLSIGTTRHIIEEVGSTIEHQLSEDLLIYNISIIPSDLTEIKTNFTKQPSQADLSLLQAAYEHPEVRGIITYDKDFSRIATAGLIERRSDVKFWLGNAKQFLEKHRIMVTRDDNERGS